MSTQPYFPFGHPQTPLNAAQLVQATPGGPQLQTNAIGATHVPQSSIVQTPQGPMLFNPQTNLLHPLITTQFPTPLVPTASTATTPMPTKPKPDLIKKREINKIYIKLRLDSDWTVTTITKPAECTQSDNCSHCKKPRIHHRCNHRSHGPHGFTFLGKPQGRQVSHDAVYHKKEHERLFAKATYVSYLSTYHHDV